MSNKYLTIFTEIAHATELLAEQVMEYNHKKSDANGEQTAKIMRENYSTLYDKLRAPGYEIHMLQKEDYLKLLVGSTIVLSNLETKLKNMQTAISTYKLDLIPKLQRIAKEAISADQLNSLVTELFKESSEDN